MNYPYRWFHTPIQQRLFNYLSVAVDTLGKVVEFVVIGETIPLGGGFDDESSSDVVEIGGVINRVGDSFGLVIGGIGIFGFTASGIGDLGLTVVLVVVIMGGAVEAVGAVCEVACCVGLGGGVEVI